MPTADELLRRRVDRIISIPNRFITGVGAAQGEIFAELIEVLSILDIGQGEISTSTLNAIDELLEQYYSRLRDGKYGSYVSWFESEITAQAELSVDVMRKSYNYVVSARAAQVLEVSKAQAVRQLLGDDFKTNFVNVIRDTLTNQITSGSTFEGLVNSMRTTVFFPEGRDGQILNWAKQVASDRFAMSDSAFNVTIADDLGLEFFVYAGGIIPDSREFCIERDGKIFHREEAAEWASLKWQGKFRQTTEQNILEVRGGYRCQHVPAFISTSIVPPEVIERVRAKGIKVTD